MTDLATLGADVEWPDHTAAASVRDRLADDPGLGKLAGLAEWVAEVLPATSEPPFAHARAVLFSAPEAAVAELADRVGVQLRVVTDLPASPTQALARGIEIADADIDAGADLLVVGLPDQDSTAAIAVSVLTDTEPVKVLARGAAATDPEAWMQRAVEVRDARRRCMPMRDEADRLLEEIGSAPLAAAAGLVLRAATRRTPVLLDGPAAAAAALLAYQAAPRAVRWWCASDAGPDPVQDVALTRLGLRSVLGLGTARGDGLAAMLAIPVLQAAARLGRDAAAASGEVVAAREEAAAQDAAAREDAARARAARDTAKREVAAAAQNAAREAAAQETVPAAVDKGPAASAEPDATLTGEMDEPTQGAP